MTDPADHVAADAPGAGSGDLPRPDAPLVLSAVLPAETTDGGDLESVALAILSADDTTSTRCCSRCQADLSRVAMAARFCPRCGLNLGPGAPASLPPPLAPQPVLAGPAHTAAAWLRIRQQARPQVLPMAGVMAADIHSEMLLGYANAMYRLGWRYETGLGTGRNVEEAIRCYFKAAKLGNPAALARLAPQCAGGGAGDVTAMPEPPASPSAQAG